MEKDVLGQHAFDGSAEGGAGLGVGPFAADPGLHEVAHHPVARLDARDAWADLGNHAGSVGERHSRQLEPRVVLSLDHQQVAVIEGEGPHLDQHLPRSRFGLRPLGADQGVEAEMLLEFVGLHGVIVGGADGAATELLYGRRRWAKRHGVSIPGQAKQLQSYFAYDSYLSAGIYV